MKSMNLNLNVIFLLWTLAESLHALVVFVLVPIARAMIPTIFLTDYNSGCDLGSDGKDDMESELRDVEADSVGNNEEENVKKFVQDTSLSGYETENGMLHKSFQTTFTMV